MSYSMKGGKYMEKWRKRMGAAMCWAWLGLLLVPGSITLIAVLILMWIVYIRVRRWSYDLWHWLAPPLEQFEVKGEE